MPISCHEQLPDLTHQITPKARPVTAAILFRNGRLLIAKRSATSNLPGKWEFPGGKMEDGETPEACLARELKEELGIGAHVGAFLGENVFQYPHGSVRLLAYRTTWVDGEFKPQVHDEIRWVSLGEIEQYDFAPADVPFVEKLLSGEWRAADE